jgi:hypothetical protein
MRRKTQTWLRSLNYVLSPSDHVTPASRSNVPSSSQSATSKSLNLAPPRGDRDDGDQAIIPITLV